MLEFIAPPFHKSAEVHEEKYRAAKNDRPTADDQTERDPTNTRHHEYQEPVLVLVAKEEDRGQSAEGSKPIDSVILQHR